MPDDKSRQWERDRRQRLSQSFYELHQLLPDYDPAVAVSKVDILIRAAAFIRHLQEERQAALEKGCTDKAQKEEITLLRSRLDELLSRTHLLASLLHTADIVVPVGPPPHPICPIRRVGAVSHAISREIRKAKRAAACKAKGLKRLAAKKVPTVDGEKNKLKSRKQFFQTKKNSSVIQAMSTPLHEISNNNRARCSVGESVLTKLSTIPSTTVSAVVAKKDAANLVSQCNTLSAPVMATGFQNGGESMLERYPQLSRLGPGTLILADGRIVSFPPIPPSQIIVNHPAPAVILMPNHQPTAPVKTKHLVSLKPKVDTTVTTFVNKVPIPSLRVHQRQHQLVVRPSAAGHLQAPVACDLSSHCMIKRVISRGNDTTKNKAKRVSKDMITRNEILKRRKMSSCIGTKRKLVKSESTSKCGGLDKTKSCLKKFNSVETGINQVNEAHIELEKIKDGSGEIDSQADKVICTVERPKLTVNNPTESSPVEDLDKMPNTNMNANTYTIDALCRNIDGEVIHREKDGVKGTMGEDKHIGDDLASSQDIVIPESEILKGVNRALTHEKISDPVMMDQITLVACKLTAGGTNGMVKLKENSVVEQLAEDCIDAIPTSGNSLDRSRDLVSEKSCVTSDRVAPLIHEKSNCSYSSEKEENSAICEQRCNQQTLDRNKEDKSNEFAFKEKIESSSSIKFLKANDKQNNSVLTSSSIADCTLNKVASCDGSSLPSTTEHKPLKQTKLTVVGSVTMPRDIQQNDKNTFIPISHHSCLDDVRLSTDLSNDLFSSLHVSSGGHHPESISPTAAFLLAFPLVSTSKTSEMLAENENSESQHATPTTILQIGNIEPPVTELFHHTSSMVLESAASLFHTLKPVILKTANADLSKQFLNESDHSERFQHLDFHERFSFDNYQFVPESTTANKTDTVGASTLSNQFRNDLAEVNNRNTLYEHRTPVSTHEGHCEYTLGVRNANIEYDDQSVVNKESHLLKNVPACSNTITDSCDYISQTQPSDQGLGLLSNTIANMSASESIHQQILNAKPTECSTVTDVPRNDKKNLSNSIPVRRKLSHNFATSMHVVPKAVTAVPSACPLSVSDNVTLSKSSYSNAPCLQNYAHMMSSQNAAVNVSGEANSFLNVPHTTTSFCKVLNTATPLHSAPVLSASKDNTTAATSVKQNTLVAHTPLQTTQPNIKYMGYMPPTTHGANLTDVSNMHNFPNMGKHLPSITHMKSMPNISHIGPPLHTSIDCISAPPSTKTYTYNYFSTSASYPIPSTHYTIAQSSMECAKHNQIKSNFSVSSWTPSVPVKHLDSNQTAPFNFHNPTAEQDQFASQPKSLPQRTVSHDKKTKSDKAVSTNSPLKYVSDFQPANASLNNKSNGGISNQSITVQNQYTMINQNLDSHNVKPKKVKSNLHPRPPVNWMTAPDLRPPVQDPLTPIIPDMMFAGQKDFDFSSANPSLSSNLSSFNIPPPSSNSQGVFVNPFSTVDLPLEATVFSEPNHVVAKNSTNVPSQHHYSWSPSKSTAPLLSHLDNHGLMIPSTLPTLVGDLALGTNTGPSTPADNSFRNFNLPNPTFSIETTAMKKQMDQRNLAQRPDKDGYIPAGLNSGDIARSAVRNVNEFCIKDHQPSHLHNSGSFLSVSQLVDQAKTEGRPISRRLYKNAIGQSELKQNGVPGKRNAMEKQSGVKISHSSNTAHFSLTKTQTNNFPFKSSSGGSSVATLSFGESKSGQMTFTNQLNNTQWGDQGGKNRMANNTRFKGGNYSAESLISANHHQMTAQISQESLELPHFHYNQPTVAYNQTQHKTFTEPSAGVSSSCNYIPSDVHSGDYSTHQNQYQNCFNFPGQTPVYPSVAPGYHPENDYQQSLDTCYLYPTSSNTTRHQRGGYANHRNGHCKPSQVAHKDRLPQTTPKVLNTKHRDGTFPTPSTSLLQSYYMPSSSSHYANAATHINSRTANYQTAQHRTTSSPGSTATTTTLTNFNLSTIFPEINDKQQQAGSIAVANPFIAEGVKKMAEGTYAVSTTSNKDVPTSRQEFPSLPTAQQAGGSMSHFATPFISAPPLQPPYQGQAR